MGRETAPARDENDAERGRPAIYLERRLYADLFCSVERVSRLFCFRRRLQQFARDKWQHRAFAAPVADPFDELVAAAADGDVARALRAYASSEESSELLASRTRDGRTPLHVAAAAGHLLVAQFLLLNGDAADLVHQLDADGASPRDLLKRRVLALDADRDTVEQTNLLDILLSPPKPH